MDLLDLVHGGGGVGGRKGGGNLLDTGGLFINFHHLMVDQHLLLRHSRWVETGVRIAKLLVTILHP